MLIATLTSSYNRKNLTIKSIGQIYNDFYDAPLSTKIYLLISIVFYMFQIYQNVISCGKFYKNIKYIHNKLFELRDYITNYTM